jgi:hypothetical protein
MDESQLYQSGIRHILAGLASFYRSLIPAIRCGNDLRLQQAVR